MPPRSGNFGGALAFGVEHRSPEVPGSGGNHQACKGLYSPNAPGSLWS